MIRIKQLREELGKSKAQVARELQIPYTTFVNYENEAREPNSEVLIMIANYFHVSVDYLIGRTENRHGNSLPVSNLVPLKHIIKVPIIGRIACGSPILAEQNYEGQTFCPDEVNADFALRCQGDSMIDANIQDGDIVFIKDTPEVENGEIAAVVVGEEATLKKVYYHGDTVTLIPANSSYEPMVFKKDEINDIRICGKAVAVLRHIY
jgi:repressor LexA